MIVYSAIRLYVCVIVYKLTRAKCISHLHALGRQEDNYPTHRISASIIPS